MELEVNREINNKNQTNEEINTFMNEVKSEMEKNKELEIKNELYNEVLKRVELAPKYKEILPETIEQCLKDASYQSEYFYFDYNEKSKEYSLTYYWDGNGEEVEDLPQKEIDEFKESGHNFFIPVNDGEMVMAEDSLKDWVVLEVEMILNERDVDERRKVKEDKDGEL